MISNCVVMASMAVLAAAGFQSGAPTAAPAAAIAPSQQSYFPSDAQMEELVRTLVERGESKGIVIGLLEPDGRRRIFAYGDAGNGRPPSSRTVFEIGSITKTFVNVILADMVRRGTVSLDDPVSKFLPAGVNVPSRNGRQITLLDLATHTSGLPRSPVGYNIPDPSNPYAQFREEDLYRFLASHELQRDIGSEFVYSNLGMGLLGHALARAAGAASLRELIRKRITGPLGMRSTDYWHESPLLATGHDSKGKAVPHWDFAVLSGAGALNSNAEDLLTYLDANIGKPRSRLELTMRDAQQPRRPVNAKGDAVGLGWQLRSRAGRTIVHHGGGTGGFQSYIGFDPVARAGVVVLGNSRGFEARDDVVFQLLKMPTE